ncbi:MAG: RNA polymerase sigma factor [Oscillospiraceae bacterium]
MSYDNALLEGYIIKTAQDDITAFEKLYNETKKIVFAYILSLNKDYFSAQDIMQDTFIKIKCHAKKYKPQGNPLGWILKIAKNEALMNFRIWKNETVVSDTENDKILNISVDPDFENRVLLQNALKVLNKKQKQVLFLHAVSGFKHREIAAILDIPIGTALYNYNQAVKKLQIEILGKEASIL